ncbi:hypothetical protein LTR97_011005 [Elasticomyces elasticus]|uniref:AB hydrolase-1 domain-containing protein n=1 Tax=Elasticomyces elasticus TaxID=574655 RepID=A0AAN8A0I7_9PEZI|nr:hypothetical protein LTR97_011005 [Elasticomyces elasticus]
MPHLEVPGASLYHEIAGSGPLLLCISGGDGTTEIWSGFAEVLKDRFTVVSYNRRGFGRSYLNDAQDYSQRLETDADDATLLINHLSPSAPAIVVGNSSGAVVTLKLLVRHPGLIRTAISYEPPLARVLHDFDDVWATHESIYATYRASGPITAYDRFGELTKTQMNGGMVRQWMQTSPYVWANIQYWFEREFMTYPQAEFDVEGELAPLKEKLVLFNGELSPRGAYQYRGNVALGEKLGVNVVHCPGSHTGHRTHAKEFGEKLVEVLTARGDFHAKP